MMSALREVKSSGISKAEKREIKESLLRDADFELGLNWTGKERRRMHSKQKTTRGEDMLFTE